MLQLQNFEFGKPQSFKVVTRKPTQLSPRRERVFVTQIRKQNCPLPMREPLSLACKATLQISLEVFSKNIATRQVEASWRIVSLLTLLLSGILLFQILTWLSPSFYSDLCLNVTFPDQPLSPPSPFLCGLGSVCHMNLMSDCLPALLKCKLHGVQKFVLFTVDSTAPGLVTDRVSDH